MPIFQHDLHRDLTRRESAHRHDQADEPVENPNINEDEGEDGNGSENGNRNSFFEMSLPDQPAHGRLGSLQSLSRKLSEESIRTELCEGPVLDSPPFPSLPDLAQNQDRGDTSSPAACTDRADLIERLKRGESPAWIPPHGYYESVWSQEQPFISPTESPRLSTAASSGLLPPPTITPEKERTLSDDERGRQAGLTIERPRSALHSGDFTHDETSPAESPSERPARPRSRQVADDSPLSWIATSPPRHFTPLNIERRQSIPVRSDEVRSALSSLSSSLSTSFVYKPPTSPLFQSQSNDDADLVSPIDLGHGIPRQQRRHTLLSPLPGSYGRSPSSLQRQTPSLRQEKSFPYQAHQPRRSLAAVSGFPISGSSPQTPSFLSRRASVSTDVSPLQHASMVGSYEESILRGRMSTTPSKPLNFLAQIGVLGLGKCKSSLRCPPHVTLPFPAVFYSYAGSSHGRSKEDDGPSPYVGQIDLENGLPNQGDEARSKRKHQSRAVERRAAGADVMDTNDIDATMSSWDARKTQRAKRISGSPRAPPGGSYRIPEKGQIQIIIKNPNKTAVKLFLVPYDLAGMEPGTKTFVRQRSYSNGPIIDNMPDLKGNSSMDRPILRYLVHLHICCVSRGRFYLYKNIRVVFANRVPDGKEKLQNEITLPEPRFTPYKAIRVMHPPLSSSTGPAASLAADAAFRRRSSGFYFGGAARAFDLAEGFVSPSPSSHPFSHGLTGDLTPVEPIPFSISASQMRTPFEDGNIVFGTHSVESPQTSRPTTQASSNPSDWDSYNGPIDKYNKLNKGDVGYGGNAFSGLINGNPAVAESLLSQRLRSLGVQKPAHEESDEFSGPTEE
ncbi:hypothetical protein F4680DRAFT_136678 [Xylaria scruposa]|nr:hypothetical protein F4680DRAFT_136678 [Xylaria scruposa]